MLFSAAIGRWKAPSTALLPDRREAMLGSRPPERLAQAGVGATTEHEEQEQMRLWEDSRPGGNLCSHMPCVCTRTCTGPFIAMTEELLIPDIGLSGTLPSGLATLTARQPFAE